MAIEKIKAVAGDAGRLGIRAGLCILLIVCLFVIFNIGFIIYSMYDFSDIENIKIRVLASIGVLLVGIVFTVLSGYVVYRYLIVYAIGLLYPHLTPLFRKICGIVINKVGQVADAVKIKQDHVAKVIDTGDMLNNMYHKKTPWLVKKGVAFAVGQIPFATILSDMDVKDVLRNGNKEKASDLLYGRVDRYLKDEILGSNSLKWVFILFIINVIVQILIFRFV